MPASSFYMSFSKEQKLFYQPSSSIFSALRAPEERKLYLPSQGLIPRDISFHLGFSRAPWLRHLKPQLGITISDCGSLICQLISPTSAGNTPLPSSEPRATRSLKATLRSSRPRILSPGFMIDSPGGVFHKNSKAQTHSSIHKKF